MLNTFLGPVGPPSITSARPRPPVAAAGTIPRLRRGRQGPPAVGTGGPKTRPPQRRTDGTSGAGAGSAIDRGSGGGDGAAGRRLGGEPERRPASSADHRPRRIRSRRARPWSRLSNCAMSAPLGGGSR